MPEEAGVAEREAAWYNEWLPHGIASIMSVMIMIFRCIAKLPRQA
jgi:hypothetical protein